MLEKTIGKTRYHQRRCTALDTAQARFWRMSLGHFGRPRITTRTLPRRSAGTRTSWSIAFARGGRSGQQDQRPTRYSFVLLPESPGLGA